VGPFIWRGRGNIACGAARASGTPRPTPQGRMSACSCERLREIGDGTAQFVVFQFKERGYQSRAMGGKRHIDEDRRLDLSVVLYAGWEFIEKYWTSTFSTAAIRTIIAALNRFTPFSYF
jgi:hypothetical protein